MGKTLLSILLQLTPDVELMIVDDGSTDSTPEILARFASQNPDSIHVFRQANAGAAAARNTAIDHSNGDFLLFVDADDCLMPGAIDTVLRELSEEDDILGWDWQSAFDGKKRNFCQATYCSPTQALQNLMGGTMKWNLWLFAIKRQLVMKNGIRFLNGLDMGEDMAFMLKCFACTNRVRQIHAIMYEYNASSPSSISQQMSEQRRAEVSQNLASAESFLMKTQFADLCQQYLPHLKLYIKRPLLIGFSKENYQLWYQWFQEANTFAFNNKALPFWMRILQWLASKRMWNSIYLCNLLYREALRLKNQ